MIFFATSALHVQDIVETEVRAAGGTEVRPTTGGVEFSGSLETGYTFCLTSRVSTRLLLGLWEHDDIQSADELYDASLQLPWEEWITTVDQTFQITHTVRNCPYLRNSKFGAIRVKDAIVDRLREHFDGERPQVDTDESDLTFHLMVDGTHVAWFVDFSGRGLHRRGYRGGQTDAVMSEYIAAALLYRSPWLKAMQAAEDQVPPLFDPFCGSGTIVIEAALWALGRAPGLVSARNFTFLNLPIHDQERYDTVIANLREQEEVASKRSIVLYGWDQDPAAVRIAQAAAEQAGVAHVIDFRVKALED
ncbi:MAG TPA: THUMP domain-containing protein, partial [Sphaerochaeta sp.]|nr:THUMP domain-containing protein [Sphaerochaeta sp.]